MRWSIFPYDLTGFLEVINRLLVLLDISVAIPSMEQCLKVSLSRFDILDSVGEILNCLLKVHESLMHKPSIKVVYSIRFELNGHTEL